MSDPTKYYTSNSIPIQEQKLSLLSSPTANSLITSNSGSSAYPFQTATPSLCETSNNSVYISDTRSRNNENAVPTIAYGTTDADRTVVGSRATITAKNIYGDPTRRPLLSPQNSILALKPSIWPNNENTMIQVSFLRYLLCLGPLLIKISVLTCSNLSLLINNAAITYGNLDG